MLDRLSAAFRAILVLALFAAGGCAANPVTGKKELVLISTEKEIETGEQHYLPSQQAEGGLYTADAELTEYVESIGRRLAAVSERELPYQFVVLNNSSPNAWALPGGKIAVNRGLLVELDNEAELAAVLGHEIVHAAARHGARAMQRDILFGAIQAGVALAGKDSEYSNYAVGGAAVALGLTSQKYSRDAERTSDYHGMKYMYAAGYDTAAAVTLQQKFVALSEGRKTDWLDGLFASHPPSAERVDSNREALAEFPPGGTLGRARYQQQLARLHESQDAYEQADHARQLLDTDPKAALEAINNALKSEAREPLFYGVKGHILARRQRYEEAVREYDNAIKLDPHPGYYEHFLGRGIAYDHLGQRARARTDLERSNQLLPTSLALYRLGGIALSDGERAHAKRLFENAGESEGEVGAAAREDFVKLDIVDAPQRYVDVQILFEDGEVVIEVKNLTAYTLGGIVVGVDAKINEETLSRETPLDRIAANTAIAVPSGVRYREEDAVEAGARVLRATLAP